MAEDVHSFDGVPLFPGDGLGEDLIRVRPPIPLGALQKGQHSDTTNKREGQAVARGSLANTYGPATPFPTTALRAPKCS
jgi:hypothetical protein